MRSLILDEMLIKARAKLWKAQERFNYFPDLYMSLNNLYAFNFSNPITHCYSLEDNVRRQVDKENGFPVFRRGSADDWAVISNGSSILLCYMEDDIFEGLLHRKYHWNNLEIGCHIMFDRRPNIYLPDVHTLMSFFHA